MLLTLGIGGFVLVLDIITKVVVMARMTEGQEIPVIPGLVTIRYIRNPGAAYGLLAGHRSILVVLATVAAVGILWYAYRSQRGLEQVALGLLLGGAVGNLVDRLRWGLVTDFFSIDPLEFVFRVFNVADTSVTFGVLLMLWGAWRPSRVEGPALR